MKYNDYKRGPSYYEMGEGNYLGRNAPLIFAAPCAIMHSEVYTIKDVTKRLKMVITKDFPNIIGNRIEFILRESKEMDM